MSTPERSTKLKYQTRVSGLSTPPPFFSLHKFSVPERRSGLSVAETEELLAKFYTPRQTNGITPSHSCGSDKSKCSSATQQSVATSNLALCSSHVDDSQIDASLEVFRSGGTVRFLPGDCRAAVAVRCRLKTFADLDSYLLMKDNTPPAAGLLRDPSPTRASVFARPQLHSLKAQNGKSPVRRQTERSRKYHTAAQMQRTLKSM